MNGTTEWDNGRVCSGLFLQHLTPSCLRVALKIVCIFDTFDNDLGIRIWVFELFKWKMTEVF